MAIDSSILAWRMPMDRGAWWAIVHGVLKSWTWLSDQAQHTAISTSTHQSRLPTVSAHSASCRGQHWVPEYGTTPWGWSSSHFLASWLHWTGYIMASWKEQYFILTRRVTYSGRRLVFPAHSASVSFSVNCRSLLFFQSSNFPSTIKEFFELNGPSVHSFLGLFPQMDWIYGYHTTMKRMSK